MVPKNSAMNSWRLVKVMGAGDSLPGSVSAGTNLPHSRFCGARPAMIRQFVALAGAFTRLSVQG